MDASLFVLRWKEVSDGDHSQKTWSLWRLHTCFANCMYVGVGLFVAINIPSSVLSTGIVI